MRDVDLRIQTISLAILASVTVAFALYLLKPVLIPFTLALFVALGLSPLVEYQIHRLKVPRALALSFSILLVIILFSLVGVLVTSSVNTMAANAGDYQSNVTQMAHGLVDALPEPLWDLLPRADIEQLTRVSAASAGTVVAQITNTILGVVSQSFVVLIFVIFLLAGGGAWSRQETGTFGRMIASVRKYLILNVALSATTGVLVGLTLAALGVPLALVFGLLTFLLNFIPTVGSIIATLLPLPIVIISPDIGWTGAVLAFAIPGSIQMLIGNVIAPKVLGDSLDLHPVVILIALMFWGMLWGGVGMVLATPLTSVIKILLNKFDSTRPVAELMAGRLENLVAE